MSGMHNARALSRYVDEARKGRDSPSMLQRLRNSRWKEAREEGERLLRFANWAGANPERMKELSFIADFAGLGALRSLKRQIQDGGMEDVFPSSRIIRKEGLFAENASAYLGKRRVRKCLREALESGPLYAENKAAEYLRWAASHGSGEARAGAAAGLVSICARAVKEKQSYLAKIHFFATDESMKTLGGALGKENAMGLVEECAKGVRPSMPSVAGFWGAMGAFAASGIQMLSGIAEGGIFDSRAIAAMGISAAIAFACIQISRATGLSRLEKRIACLLDGKAGQESFKNPIF